MEISRLGRSKYVLVTGSVHADIGKGTVAATFGRALARAGERVAYVKIDPCLQGSIDAMPDTAFGEILRTPNGLAVDVDVARAAFLIPGFAPTHSSQRSLGRVLRDALSGWDAANAPCPRLADGLGALGVLDERCLSIVEVGGTAGEREHELVLEGLLRHAGPPVLHLHVTAIVASADGRPTSKPAQIGMSRLAIAPDVVLVRGNGTDLDVLRVVLQRTTRIVPLDDAPAAPEDAAWRALESAGLGTWQGVALSAPFERREPLGEVCVVGDVPAASCFNMWSRVRLWSHGRLHVRFGAPSQHTLGVVLVGAPSAPAPTLTPEQSVFDLRRSDARAPSPNAPRPDWEGTLDAPSGALAVWIAALIERPRTPAVSVTSSRPSPYAAEDFARRYLEASDANQLRDHDVLDALIQKAMGDVSGRRVVDLGCGAGRWSARLVEAGAQVVGVEPSEPMADAAARRELPNFTLRRTSAEQFEPEGRFDGALASMSLDHVEHLDRVVARVASALLPGGWFIVTTEHPLRTAPTDGARWVGEPQGRAARVRDYGSPGWRALSWFGRPEPVWVFHRTLSDWVRSLRHAGLILEAVEEPVSPDPRDAGNPRFWMLLARRPR